MAYVTTRARINTLGCLASLSDVGVARYTRQLMLSNQVQLKPNTESTNKAIFRKNHSYKVSTTDVHHVVPALLGGTALVAPLIFPAPVFAAAAEQAATQVTATTPQFSHAYHMVDDRTICMGCMVLGTTFSVLTLATTGRFILSL
jgi:hypothetical protein